MILLKSCPRCGGDLHYNRDMFGQYFACIQCGYYLTDVEEIELRLLLLVPTGTHKGHTISRAGAGLSK